MPLLLLLLFLSLGFTANAQKHILFVVVDDLGFADLGYKADIWNITSQDGVLFSTPFLDSVASEGVKLEGGYYVQFLCSPSRTAMLSGRFAYTTGMNDEVIVNGQPDQLPTNIKTIADHLSEHGWSTAAFGKWDLGSTSWGCTPLCRGFSNFSGFYNAFNAYFTHVVGPGLDLRIASEPDFLHHNETGIYETTLITSRVQEFISYSMYNRPSSPTFAYVAHQGIHAPQQVPKSYLDGYCSSQWPGQPVRQVACAQMRAIDESIQNISNTYKSLGIWNDTLLIFTTDNGGNTDTGGVNFPLRGVKATMFEGGMRGAAFVSGAGLSSTVKGTVDWENIYSLVDWLPTIVGGIAGINLTETLVPKYPYQPAPPLIDGMDIWQSLSQGTPSPRTEVLLNLCPTTCYPSPSSHCQIPGMGAYRQGKWKLIHGHVAVWYNAATNVSGLFCGDRDNDVASTIPDMNVTRATSPPFCVTGWVRPNMSVVPPADILDCHSGRPGGPVSLPCSIPADSKYHSGGVWLFDVVADPTETTDVAAQYPEIVATLLARLQSYNDTQIPQSNSPQDPAAQPSHFGDVWTPWRGNPDPSVCDPNVTNRSVVVGEEGDEEEERFAVVVMVEDDDDDELKSLAYDERKQKGLKIARQAYL